MRQLPLPFIEGLHGLLPSLLQATHPAGPKLAWHAHRNHEPQPQCDKGRVKSAKPVRRDKTEKG